jgi:hypothetical protein
MQDEDKHNSATPIPAFGEKAKNAYDLGAIIAKLPELLMRAALVGLVLSLIIPFIPGSQLSFLLKDQITTSYETSTAVVEWDEIIKADKNDSKEKPVRQEKIYPGMDIIRPIPTVKYYLTDGRHIVISDDVHVSLSRLSANQFEYRFTPIKKASEELPVNNIKKDPKDGKAAKAELSPDVIKLINDFDDKDMRLGPLKADEYDDKGDPKDPTKAYATPQEVVIPFAFTADQKTRCTTEKPVAAALLVDCNHRIKLTRVGNVTLGSFARRLIFDVEGPSNPNLSPQELEMRTHRLIVNQAAQGGTITNYMNSWIYKDRIELSEAKADFGDIVRIQGNAGLQESVWGEFHLLPGSNLIDVRLRAVNAKTTIVSEDGTINSKKDEVTANLWTVISKQPYILNLWFVLITVLGFLSQLRTRK